MRRIRPELHLYDTSPFCGAHPATASSDMEVTYLLYACTAFAKARDATLLLRRLHDGDTGAAAEGPGARAATRATCRRLRDRGLLPLGTVLLDDDCNDDEGGTGGNGEGDIGGEDNEAKRGAGALPPGATPLGRRTVRGIPPLTGAAEFYEAKVAGRYRSPPITWDRVASMRADDKGQLVVYNEHVHLPEFRLW